MSTRAEEIQEVRRLLGHPAALCPDPDLIISQLLRQEQLMLNRLNGTGKAWTISTTTVASVAGTSEYAVTPQAGAAYGFGKALFVYRSLDNDELLPVPFTDYPTELHDQSYSFVNSTYQAGVYPRYHGEKIAFFRTPGAAMMRIYPTPDAVRTYAVTYAAGRVDPAEIALSDVPVMPEWSNLRTIQAALFLLPHAKWDGLTFDQNERKQKNVAMALAPQVAEYKEEFLGHLQNPQHDPETELGYWYD